VFTRVSRFSEPSFLYLTSTFFLPIFVYFHNNLLGNDNPPISGFGGFK